MIIYYLGLMTNVAQFVDYLSIQKDLISSSIWKYTLEKNLLYVMFAAEHLDKRLIWWSMWPLTDQNQEVTRCRVQMDDTTNFQMDP